MSDEEIPRWIDDDTAPSGLRADLRAEREAAPPALDYAAGLAALQASIAGGGPGGGDPSTGEPSAAGSGAAGSSAAGSSAATLVGAGLAVTLAVALGAWAIGAWPVGREGPSTPAHAPNEAPNETVPAPAPPTVASEEASDVAVSEDDTSTAPGEPDPLAASEIDVPARHRREPPADPDRLRREMEQLELARRALDTDPARALALTRAAHAEFGDGTFGAERDAIGVLALFRLGRSSEARPRALRLLRRDPSGLYADRLREALATP